MAILQTVCALQWFILAMTLYPDVQRKAQAEIDSVVGHDRLPDFNDQPLLPYIDAMVKEVLRSIQKYSCEMVLICRLPGGGM